MNTLGQQLKRARNRRGLTLIQVERLTGIERTHVSRLENDRSTNAYLRTIESLANIYGCSMDWLLGRQRYCRFPFRELGE